MSFSTEYSCEIERSSRWLRSCTVLRMWANYKNPMSNLKLLNSGTSRFRTIFITSNPVLRSEVRKYFDGLLRGLAATFAAKAQVAAIAASPEGGIVPAAAVEGEGEGGEAPVYNLHSLADLPDRIAA